LKPAAADTAATKDRELGRAASSFTEWGDVISVDDIESTYLIDAATVQMPYRP